jgi:uncharacterized protein
VNAAVTANAFDRPMLRSVRMHGFNRAAVQGRGNDMTGVFVARWLMVFGLIVALLPLHAQSQATVPAMHSAVVDTTATLTSDERARIEASIAPYEARKGSQMQVLMVPSTQPESIDEYAVRAFAQWKLGRKGIDDGVLIVVARDDHHARIEVGYGLEGAIPDAAASRILEDRMLPKFHDNDYAGGIADGVDALIGLADGEPLPAPTYKHAGRTTSQTIGIMVGIGFACLIGGVFLALPIAGAIYAWRHKRRGFWMRLIVLAVLACIAWGRAALSGETFNDSWPPFALMSYLVVTFTFISAFPKSSGGSSSSDDDSSSSSSDSESSSSSSSDSDDDRSGDGGSSGGGGASGSW